MSSNFHDTTAVMVGVDEHYFLIVGPYDIPIPEKRKHVVIAGNFWWSNEKRTTNVTSEGNKMIQKGFELGLVPHIPNPSGAHVAEIAWLAFVIADSESKPLLSVASVTGNGVPLTACIIWLLDVYKNCEGWGICIDPNSVKTQPTLADYAAALAGVALDFIIGKLLEWLLGKYLGEGIGRDAAKWVVDKILKPLVDKINDFVQDQTQKGVSSVQGMVNGAL